MFTQKPYQQTAIDSMLYFFSCGKLKINRTDITNGVTQTNTARYEAFLPNAHRSIKLFLSNYLREVNKIFSPCTQNQKAVF